MKRISSTHYQFTNTNYILDIKKQIGKLTLTYTFPCFTGGVTIDQYSSIEPTVTALARKLKLGSDTLSNMIADGQLGYGLM